MDSEAEATETPKNRTRSVAVVVLNYDGLADTRACLQSLRGLDYPAGSLEIVVVDNGSGGGQAAALREEFPEFTHRPNETNRGFTGGVNTVAESILAEGHHEFIALLNNDTVVEPDWITRLLDRAAKSPEIGMVASLMVFFDEPDTVENAGAIFLASGDAIPIGRGSPAAKYRQAQRIPMFCAGAVLLRGAMLREIGLFRTDFFANFEDADLSLRAAIAGWQCWLEPASTVRHKLSRTIDKVRDREFCIRSQRNLMWTALVNHPAPVLLVDLPFLLVREFLLLIICPLLLLRGVASSVFAARRQVFCERRAVLAARREVLARKKVSSFSLLWRQGFFLPRWWWPFFRDVVLKRKRSYMNQPIAQETPAHG